MSSGEAADGDNNQDPQTGRGTSPNFQDAMVQEMTSFYEFLERLYLFPDTVEHPPASGWPSITQESLAPLNKNDAVINLLRHIPYFAPNEGSPYCIARKTWPIGYNRPGLQRKLATSSRDMLVEPALDTSVEGGKLPSHAVCLFIGKRDSYFMVADTKRELVVWASADGGGGMGFEEFWIDRSLTPEEIDPDGPDWWMDNPTYHVKDFFEMLKRRFNDMKWMPHPYGPADVWEADSDPVDPDELDAALKKVMVDAGWPGDGDAGGWRRDKMQEGMEREDDWM